MIEVEMKVRTSIAAKYRKLGEHLGSFDANTHLVGKSRPPDDDKYPDFVKYWDVSVLRNPRDDQYAIM